jgi:enoyl-CoA hydratase/carnithine racemase
MTVGYDVTDRVAVITLARAPQNALSLPFLDAILAALRRAAADDAVRAVVLRSGLQRTFCAGLDLDLILGRSREEVREFLQRLYVDLADAQHAMGKPAIAAVGGAARGGGMTLAISCNVILAGEQASFGYPEIKLGLPPAIHFAHLPQIVGRHRAYELLFSGRTFGPAEAAQLGLVSRVTDAAGLDRAAMDLAMSFARHSPVAMRAGHAAFMRANDLRDAIRRAVDDFCDVAATPDAQEGIRAFLEKRPPRWSRG